MSDNAGKDFDRLAVSEILLYGFIRQSDKH